MDVFIVFKTFHTLGPFSKLLACFSKAGIRNTNKTHMQFVNALTSYKTL